MSRIVLFGAFGFGNLGDELLADYYRTLLSEAFSGLERVLLCAYPLKTAAMPGEVFYHRRHLPRLLREIKPGDIWIGCGGSLLQNRTSRRSLLFYLTLIRAAKLRKAKVALLGQGFGPVYGGFWQKTARRVLSKVDLVEARDRQTLDFFKGVPIEAGKIGRVADPVWGVPIPVPTKIQEGKDTLMVLRREDTYGIRRLLKNDPGTEIRVLALAPSDRFALKKACGEKFEGVADRLPVFWSSLEKAGMVFSSRLHGVVLAALGGAKVVGLGGDPKLLAVCSELKIPCLKLGDIHRLPEDNQVDTADLKERVEGLRDAAIENRGDTLVRLRHLAELN